MGRQDLMGNAGLEMLQNIQEHGKRCTAVCSDSNKLLANANWAALAREGFTVLPGFCTAEEVKIMKQTYDAIPANENKNYQAKDAEFPESVMAKFRELLPYISKAGTPVDQVWPAQVYATKQAGQDNRFDWHIDQGTFSICGTHHAMYNLYLAVYKTTPVSRARAAPRECRATSCHALHSRRSPQPCLRSPGIVPHRASPTCRSSRGLPSRTPRRALRGA